MATKEFFQKQEHHVSIAAFCRYLSVLNGQYCISQIYAACYGQEALSLKSLIKETGQCFSVFVCVIVPISATGFKYR